MATKYTDIDFLLTKNDLTNDINVKYDGNAISQSIKNIILTTQKEKLFSQYFGGNAYDLVFNSLSYVEIADKQLFLESAIKNNEPRVNVQSINIVYSEEGSWIISVLYNQKNSNNLAQNVTVTI